MWPEVDFTHMAFAAQCSLLASVCVVCLRALCQLQIERYKLVPAGTWLPREFSGPSRLPRCRVVPWALGLVIEQRLVTTDCWQDAVGCLRTSCRFGSCRFGPHRCPPHWPQIVWLRVLCHMMLGSIIISAPTPTPGPLELTVCPIFFVKRSHPVFSRIMCIVHVRDPPSAGSSELQKAACHLHAGSRDIFPSTFIQVIIGYRCKKRWVNLDIR